MPAHRPRPPSALRTILICAVVAPAAMWLEAAIENRRHVDSWADLRAFVMTPFAVLVGLLGGWLLWWLRRRRYLMVWGPPPEARLVSVSAHRGVRLGDSSKRRRRLALSAAAIVVICAVIAATRAPFDGAMTMPPSTVWLPTVIAAAVGIPFLVVGLVGDQPGGVTRALTAGLAWSTAIVLILMAFLAAAEPLLPGSGAASYAAIDVAWAVGWPGLALLVLLFVVSIEIARTVGTTSSAHRRAGFGVPMLYAALLVTWLVHVDTNSRKREEKLHAAAVAESKLARVDAVSRMRGWFLCLRGYASARPDSGFPVTLEAASTSGGACQADAVPHDSSIERWVLRYQPVDRDARGRATDFWIAAAPRDATGEMLYIHATGALYEATYPVHADSFNIGNGRTRLVSDGFVPPIPPAPGQNLALLDSPVYALDAFRRCVLSVHAAPAAYGSDGIRSYFFDETGAVHVTTDDRAATLGDPIIVPCERSGVSCRYGGR